MKTKIATALKTKYQRFGLSNEAIDRIASAKEKTVTTEEGIEAGIADAETMNLIANELQKMRDGEIQKRTDLQKSFDTYKTAHPDQQGEQDGNDDMPAWAKTIIEQNTKLTERLDANDKRIKLENALAKVKAGLEKAGCTNKGILSSTLKGFSLGENETADDAVTRLTGEYNDLYKETFGESPLPPLGSGQQGGDPKKAVEAKNDFLRRSGKLPPKETK